MSIVLLTAAIALGVPGLLSAAHLGALAAASVFYRERPSGEGEARFLVLVPAHDEAAVIASCLDAIRVDCGAADRVLVVADRCTDATASIARSAGADVLERGPDDAPGRAAARQAGLEHVRADEGWDAVLMLDADSVVRPGFFAACRRALGPDVVAVQARSESAAGRSWPAEVATAAFTLQGITIPRGRARLGLSVRLRGTGMAIRRDVALAHRFRAPASEDLFFTLDLLSHGLRCAHVDRARLVSLGANSWRSFRGQKVRYEAGRMAAARTFVPTLLRRGARGDASCVEAALFLLTPPFALAALCCILASLLATAAGATVVAALFGTGFLTLTFTLFIGLVQARARPRTWLALVIAPWYMVWKAAVQIRALVRVARREQVYEPTARA